MPVKPFLLLATRPEDAAADGEYEAFLRHAGLQERELVRIRVESVPIPTLDPADWSGIFVGGSPFTGSIPREHKGDTQLRVEAELARVLDMVVDVDFPFLGACYGVGTLGSHQGASIDGTYAEPISAPTVELTEAGLVDPLLAGVAPEFQAFVGHKEAVSRLPEHAVLLARSASCPVQMFRVKTHLYATQFHPELDVEGICTRIEVYKHAGYFAPEEAESLKELARDSVVVHPPRLLRRFVELYGAS